jgi:hypothetical protein
MVKTARYVIFLGRMYFPDEDQDAVDVVRSVPTVMLKQTIQLILFPPPLLLVDLLLLMLLLMMLLLMKAPIQMKTMSMSMLMLPMKGRVPLILVPYNKLYLVVPCDRRKDSRILPNWRVGDRMTLLGRRPS